MPCATRIPRCHVKAMHVLPFHSFFELSQFFRRLLGTGFSSDLCDHVHLALQPLRPEQGDSKSLQMSFVKSLEGTQLEHPLQETVLTRPRLLQAQLFPLLLRAQDRKLAE